MNTFTYLRSFLDSAAAASVSLPPGLLSDASAIGFELRTDVVPGGLDEIERMRSAVDKLSLSCGIAQSQCADIIAILLPEPRTEREELVFNYIKAMAEQTIMKEQRVKAASSLEVVLTADRLTQKLGEFRAAFDTLMADTKQKREAIVQDFAALAVGVEPEAPGLVLETETASSSTSEPIIIAGFYPAKIVEAKINELITSHNNLVASIQGLSESIKEEAAETAKKIARKQIATLTPEECVKFAALHKLDTELVQRTKHDSKMPKLEALEQRAGELVGFLKEVDAWKAAVAKQLDQAFKVEIDAYIDAYRFKGVVPNALLYRLSSYDTELAKTEFVKVATL